ncbi:MAG TPA: hypothetical protein VEL05_02180 [Candidatus Acidoferrum sp.]|nr:hypothetical protein [Candidatus Acidoferrum sp.]
MPILNVTISKRPDPELVRRIAHGLVERTASVLRKRPDVTAVAVQFVPPEHWIVGGRSLAEAGLASFWLDIKIVDGSNTKDEKAAYLREVFSFMEEVLGPLHPESYILVHDVRADAYGFGGLTQEHRYIRGKLDDATR